MEKFNLNVENDTLKGIDPFVQLIEQIMEIPEESLNETSIDIISGMIQGALTPKIKQDSINSIKKELENNNYRREQAQEALEESKQLMLEIVDNFKPSPNKKALINVICEFFNQTFDEALGQYHTYDITLPIQLGEGATCPTYAHSSDACADIYASKNMTIPAHSLSNLVPTGLRIELPENWVFMLEPRSSIGYKTGLRLSNAMGIIDEDYRGEIGILFDNFSDSDYEIKAGDRLVQGWVQPVYRFKPIVVDNVSDTERGTGGFGSTGK